MPIRMCDTPLHECRDPLRRYDLGMTGTPQSTPARPAPSADDGERIDVRVLLHSDDVTTRDTVRAAVGRRPAKDVRVTGWRECATQAAVVEAVEAGGLDVLVLDGEAAKLGGMGLCRQLKGEIFQCPPVIVLTGRPQDGWLATWSMADAVVPHPLDPIALAETVARVAREQAAR